MENGKLFGEEKLSRLMLKYSIPCILSLLVASLYSIVDQIFIGNSELSTLGNAATGVVFPFFIITNAFAWCFGDGCAAFLNICQGRKDDENAHIAIGTGTTLTILTGLLLIAFFMPLKRPLLMFFGASDNNIEYAVEYFNIILVFFPFYMFSNFADVIIRADGSPNWSMVAMISGAVVNIILDPIFINLLELGMKGAALATVIGQAVSFALCFAYMFRTKTFKLKLKSFIPNFKVFKDANKLGLSSFLNQITVVVITLLANLQFSRYGAMSVYGSDIPIAAVSIQSKVFTIVLNIIVGLVLGCQPIISYNMGAKKYDRVRKLFKNIMICTIIICLIFTAIVEIWPRAVASIFGSPKNIPNPDDYWDFAEKTFRIYLSLLTFTCLIKALSIFFQATGNPVRAIISSLIRDLLGFTPCIFILPLFFGVEGILWAGPICDILSIIIASFVTVNFFKNLKDESIAETPNAVIKDSKKGIIVTLSREHGSAGKTIAKKLSEKLQVPFYCKELISLAAQESGLDKEYIGNTENENRDVKLYSLYCSTANTVATAISAQEKIISEIAKHGSCVIVGRCADYFLKDNKNVVNVFVKANEEFKIKNIMNMYGDDYEHAKKNIEKSDKARAKYYKVVTGREWKDMANYDLVLNSADGIDKCVDILYDYVLSEEKKLNENS